jgi:hypothetical protein
MELGILNRLKIMAQGPLRFSTIGKPILRTFEFFEIFRFFDLPYGQGQGHGQGHGQGQGQGQGRSDGRTDGAILFSEMRNPVTHAALECMHSLSVLDREVSRPHVTYRTH